MIRFLTTAESAAQIERLAREAKETLTLVSPYLQISSQLIERIIAAEKRDAKVRLVYGKNRKIAKGTRERLARLSDLELHFYEHLHAKCYFNEEALVITSMNLYEYSEKNNREMGIVVSVEEAVYQQARAEVADIIGQSEQNALLDTSGAKEHSSAGGGQTGRKPKAEGNGVVRTIKRAFSASASEAGTSSETTASNGGVSAPSKGFCIRCSRSITYDPTRPYCWTCFQSWTEWENRNYEEPHCHRCGEEMGLQPGRDSSSMERPECKRCYKKRRAEERS